jgi:hypothetical protein
MGKRSIIRITNSRNKDGGESWTFTHNVSTVRITNPRSRALNYAMAWLIPFLSFGPLSYFFYNFSGFSFNYTMFQGIFVATITLVITLIVSKVSSSFRVTESTDN